MTENLLETAGRNLFILLQKESLTQETIDALHAFGLALKEA